MKAHKTILRIKTIFLTVILLLQSCSSYQGSYTIQQAYHEQKKVQITTTANQKIDYHKIDTLNGQWIGLKHKNARIAYEVIDPASVQKIQIQRSQKDEGREGLGFLALITVPVLVLLWLAAVI